jgi:hypothetical protein
LQEVSLLFINRRKRLWLSRKIRDSLVATVAGTFWVGSRRSHCGATGESQEADGRLAVAPGCSGRRHEIRQQRASRQPIRCTLGCYQKDSSCRMPAWRSKQSLIVFAATDRPRSAAAGRCQFFYLSLPISMKEHD